MITIITSNMTSEEARLCIETIKAHVGRARTLLLDLYERQGWIALGYENWRECVINEFGQSQSYLYRQIEAAQVEINISPMGEIGNIPERHLRPLTNLEPGQQSEAWQKAVETAPEGKITAQHVQNVVDEIRGKTNVHISDDSYEWYTPVEYIEAARKVMGTIDLDPASCFEAQEMIKAERFYAKEEDGLKQEWTGNIWLNPPYCMPDIESFAELTILNYSLGKINQAIVLTNNATDTKWFHHLLLVSGLACLPVGRIKFWGPDSRETAGPRQGQTIFYLGSNVDSFINEFGKFGVIIKSL